MNPGRRRFLAKASGVVVAGAAIIGDAPNVIAQPKIQWRLSTAYPPILDQLLGAAQRLAKLVHRSWARTRYYNYLAHLHQELGRSLLCHL